jgi:hypothetical protein
MLKNFKPLAVVTAAAMAITGLGITPGFAGTASSTPASVRSAVEKVTPVTDFSSRRRHYGYGRNNAAALGTFLAIAGGVAAVAAARRHRHHYYAYGPYGYGYGAPYAYGGPYGYGPRYYRYGW